jgi:hypothetical protein
MQPIVSYIQYRRAAGQQPGPPKSGEGLLRERRECATKTARRFQRSLSAMTECADAIVRLMKSIKD